MSLTRRYSAALFAASALLLGACGGDNAPTNPTDTPEIGDNPRIISISPSSMIFESENGVVPGPQTLATSGLVAIGSAVTFGPVDYGASRDDSNKHACVPGRNLPRVRCELCQDWPGESNCPRRTLDVPLCRRNRGCWALRLHLVQKWTANPR